jgi:hypothetical protein
MEYLTLGDLALLITQTEKLKIVNVGNPDAFRELAKTMTDYQIGVVLGAVDNIVRVGHLFSLLRIPPPQLAPVQR